MGEVCACRYCRRLFKSVIKRAVCPDCISKDNEQFDVIRDFLIENPNSNAVQVSQHTNISTSEILRYVDEGRLTVVYSDYSYLLKIG